MNAPTPEPWRGGRVSVTVLGAIGLLAFALLLWGFRSDPQHAFRAYLSAYAYALSIVLGCIGFVMISHAANTTWPVALRRLPEAVAPAMPLLAALFIPVLFGVHTLYPWAHPDDYAGHVRDVLEHRRAFMNPGFFTLRAAVYLTLWSGFAWPLRGYSLAMDGEGARAPQDYARRLRALSYAGLPLISLTTAFASFEWFMSLSPEFASTMFGANWIACCLFGGIAATTLLTGIAHRAQPLAALGPSHYSALGRLLLAFLVFLGYTEFFQYLLAWMGNRPTEAAWYLARGDGVFAYVSLFLLVGQFALPFFALLSYRLKRNIVPLTWVAAWCLFAHYFHLHWLIAPDGPGSGFSWLDPVACVAVLATTSAFCIALQRGKSLAPGADPRFVASFSYESH